MAKTREQKKEIVEDLKQKIRRKKSIVFIDFSNLKARDIFELREKLKEKDCLLKVAKKTLMDSAFREKKLKVDLGKLEGQIGLVFSFGKEILPAKIVYDFSQEFGAPKILGGYIGNEFLEAEKMIELAKLPSREEILGRIVGSLRAPIFNLQMILERPLQRLTFILRGRIK